MEVIFLNIIILVRGGIPGVELDCSAPYGYNKYNDILIISHFAVELRDPIWEP